jgi:diacylglycerol kinase family enzyme
MDTCIVLNLHANNRRALTKWEKIEFEVLDRIGDHRFIRGMGLHEAVEAIGREISEGVRTFVAAGGDGTVNTVLNAICTCRGDVPLDAFTLGAIGLGSSNDFLKPIRSENTIHGVPVKVRADGARPRDVGIADYADGSGEKRRRYFIINASLGLVAAANAFFNSGGKTLGWLKRNWVEGSILYSAFNTLMDYRNFPAVLVMGDERHETELTNLSVMKIPHVSGNFCYGMEIPPNDGLFAVNLCEGMSRREVIKTMMRLYEGIFLGLPKTRSWRAAGLRVETAELTALEMDGEVVEARDIDFTIHPESIRECL